MTTKRRTQDVKAWERDTIRTSIDTLEEIARTHDLTLAQVDYIRSSKAPADPIKPTWTLRQEARLNDLYDEMGWAPSRIAAKFPDKTFSQVYRKMVREIKGR